MTPKDPAPGAHNHVAGVPDESFAYVADPEADPEALRSIAAALGDPMTSGQVQSIVDVQRLANEAYVEERRRTVTVRVYYKGPGNPRAAVESALRQWSPKVFETELFDA